MEVLFWFCFEIVKLHHFKNVSTSETIAVMKKTHEIRREKVTSNGDEMYTFIFLHQIQNFKAKCASGMCSLRNDTEAGAVQISNI